VFVAVSITETELPPLFPTYTRLPSGVIAITPGPGPTAMVPLTAFVAALITEIVLSAILPM
jgi:hypothetical protein